MACITKEQCIRKIKNRLKTYGTITVGIICISMLSCQTDGSNETGTTETVSSNSIKTDNNADDIKDINIFKLESNLGYNYNKAVINYDELLQKCEEHKEDSIANVMRINETNTKIGGDYVDGNIDNIIDKGNKEMFNAYTLYFNDKVLCVYMNVLGDMSIVAAKYENNYLEMNKNNNNIKVCTNDNIIDIFNDETETLVNIFGKDKKSSDNYNEQTNIFLTLIKYKDNLEKILSNTNSIEYYSIAKNSIQSILINKPSLYDIDDKLLYTDSMYETLLNNDVSDEHQNIELSIFEIGRSSLDINTNDMIFTQFRSNNKYINVIFKINENGKIFDTIIL